MDNILKKIIITPTEECDGCRKCVDACSQAICPEGTEPSAFVNAIKITKSMDINIPNLCKNCLDAPCVSSCMTGCITQEENGLVITDTNRCVGCWMCVMNCPFGAIERSVESHVAVKCNGCVDYDVAPCVAVCERGVLSHMDIGDLTERLRREAAERFVRGAAGSKVRV